MNIFFKKNYFNYLFCIKIKQIYRYQMLIIYEYVQYNRYIQFGTETFNNVHCTENIRVKNKIGKSHTKIIVFYWSNHKEGVWGVKPPPEPETKLLVNKKIKKFTNKIWTWGTWTFKVRPLKEHIFFVCVSPYSPVKYFFIFHTTTWMKVNLYRQIKYRWRTLRNCHRRPSLE